jgi:hypothetical protein
MAVARRGNEWFEGRALGMRTQRAANEPSFERSCDLLVGAPTPDQDIPVNGCPMPPARQRDLGVDEASKVGDQQAELEAADSVQWRARPALIDCRPPLPTGYCKRFAEIRLRGAWHRAPAVGRTLLLQPPPHAADGRRRRARLLRADAWPPHPRAEQPNLNSSDTTPIPVEYKWVQKPAFAVRSERVGVEPCARFRRISSNDGELVLVSSTDSRARRSRR